METVADATLLDDPGSHPRSSPVRILVYYEATDGAHSQIVELPEGSEITFGRSRANAIAIESERVSRNHAKLSHERTGELIVEDLASRNGTLVNGHRIDAPTQVAAGDELTVGPATVMISIAKPLPRRADLGTSELLDARLEAECDRGARYKRPFALMMVRLTGDAAAGDQVVSKFQAAIRPMDVLAEYSPDEIGLLFPEANESTAAGTAERLAELSAPHAKPGVLTVGIGVARFPDHGTQGGELISRARAALHKTSGPVGVAIAESAQSSTEDSQLIIADQKMKRVYELAAKVADSNMTVLITGETGAGKEVVAEALHRRSRRRDKPYIRINCACLTETLLESELFGHERGSFTGADRRKVGYFEACDGGSLFLDEIGEMPMSLQSKLLRVLEENRFTRVGGTKEIEVDVRVLCATNRDLAREVQSGRFREDLFFRVSAFTIMIPPLRERPEEIVLLAETFLRQATERLGGPAPTINPNALRLLRSYAWPGNVRELRNAMERAAVLDISGDIDVEHLPDRIRLYTPVDVPASGALVADGADMKETIADVERLSIVKSLESCGGNQTRAAKQLGISRRSLIYKMEKHGLKPPPGAKNK